MSVCRVLSVVDGEFQNSQEIDPCRNGVRIGFARDGCLDAPDRGIVPCVLQGDAPFRQRLDERNVIEEKGNAAATEDKLATTLEKRIGHVSRHADRQVAQLAETIGCLKKEIAHVVDRALALRSLSAEGNRLDVVVQVQLDRKLDQPFQSLLPGDASFGKVFLVVGIG